MNNKMIFCMTLLLFLPIAAMDKSKSIRTMQSLTRKNSGETVINMGQVSPRPRRESLSQDMFVLKDPLVTSEKISVGLCVAAGLVYYYNVYTTFNF